jgi:exonuclease SbcD
VNIHLTYSAGIDNLEEILKQLEAIFPRWYHRDWQERSSLGPTLVVGENTKTKSFEETVREYILQELMNHNDEEQKAIIERLEALFQEME